jgi:hypothetical protein
VLVSWIPGVTDRHYLFGGEDWASNPPQVLDSVLRADLLPTQSASYTACTPMGPTYKRFDANATILPNRQIIVIGGKSTPNGAQQTVHVLVPQMFDPANTAGGTWTPLTSHDSPRSYHSTAVLLTDGRVWSAGGGNARTCDFQLFSPPYITCSPVWRPWVTGVDLTTMAHDGIYQVSLGGSESDSIGGVALIRPGSATHSRDFDQRYIDCPITDRSEPSAPGQEPWVKFRIPNNKSLVPPGYYMLWVTATVGTSPANSALFVYIQP